VKPKERPRLDSEAIPNFLELRSGSSSSENNSYRKVGELHGGLVRVYKCVRSAWPTPDSPKPAGAPTATPEAIFPSASIRTADWPPLGPKLRPTGPPVFAPMNRLRLPSGWVRSAALRIRRCTSFQVQDDGFELGERLHRVASSDAPDARVGAGPSAEGKVALPVVRGGVYVDPPGSHGLGEA
jgi:hypothetical protein